MTSFTNPAHDLSNTFEAIMGSLEAIEIKLQNKDVKGALETLSLVKDKKLETEKVLQKIKDHLKESEV